MTCLRRLHDLFKSSRFGRHLPNLLPRASICWLVYPLTTQYCFALKKRLPARRKPPRLSLLGETLGDSAEEATSI